MVEAFGLDRAFEQARNAVGRAKGKDVSFWMEVVRELAPKRPVVYPSDEAMERKVQNWAALTGAVWRIEGENVVLPIKQKLFGYVPQS